MRYIKKKFLLLAVLIFNLGIFSASAQPVNIQDNPKYGPDSASRMECANNLSTMSEFMKIDLFNYALPSWHKVFDNCPESSKNIYLYGIKIYRDRLDKATDPDLKSHAFDTLMLIYDLRIKYFGQEGMVSGRKGLDLLKYDNNQVEAYDLLRKSLEISKAKTEPSVIVTLMQLSNALFNAEAIEGRELIDNYLATTDILEAKIKAGKSRSQSEKALKNVEAIFANSGAADCETLLEIFTPKFEETPEDLAFLTKLTSLLVDQNCEDTELFASASENLYKLEPSAQAAYNLATLFFKKEEYDKSVIYYQESIDNEEDPIKKAKYQYELALIKFSKYEFFNQARNLARNAAANNPEWGEPYILIGNLYASSSNQCGDNDFEKSAVFWVAVDKYSKAKSVDPSVNDKAMELIKKYSEYFPNAEDAFFYGFENGQPFTVGCWINENTTVRTQNR